jgi:hypothetical protein
VIHLALWVASFLFLACVALGVLALMSRLIRSGWERLKRNDLISETVGPVGFVVILLLMLVGFLLKLGGFDIPH